MITQYRPSYYQAPRAPSFAGRSIDDKPLHVENGATFNELDTGRTFRYDKENNKWIEQETSTPVKPSKPEQTKTVDLNMASGNQTISPDEGKTLSSVTVTKPTTMIPANIKTGVSIGGVKGNLIPAKDEQSKTVDLVLSTGDQVVQPDTGKVLSSVVISKPETLVASNIKSGIAIAGITGTLSPAKAEETKTVDLSMASGDQTITPTAGKVMTSVKVTKPTTMTAGNIKKGVVIGGVTGTYDNAPTGTYVEETYDASHTLTSAKLHGYTFVRGFMFDNCPNLTNITLCDGITSIGTQAFDGDKTLATINLPTSLVTISSYAFRGCATLAIDVLPANLVTVAMYAFQACAKVKIAALPSKLATVGKFAFHGCTGMTISEIPASVTTIDEDGFYGCTGITSLTFKGTPTTIAGTAFGGCTNLTEIKVPWAEGAVANAPWGATNATITYDYTGA